MASPVIPQGGTGAGDGDQGSGIESVRISNSNLAGISTISNPFRWGSVQQFTLPTSKINSKQYAKKYTQLLQLKNVLDNEQRNVDEHSGSSEQSKESLSSVHLSEFPLINHTEWMFQNKAQGSDVKTKKRSRCQIVQSQPKERLLKPVIRNLTVPVNSSNKTDHLVPENWKRKEILVAEPSFLLFQNFKVGMTYRKTFKVKNKSVRKCTFTMNPLGGKTQFRVEWNSPLSPLAAGISVKLAVIFSCHSLADVQEQLVFDVMDGDQLIVQLFAMSPPPHLIELTEMNSDILEPNWPIESSLIDCGSHLVGEEGQFFITLTNMGSHGRFCFLREIDWYTLEYEIDSSNCIEIDSFTIEPMYFSLDRGQHIDIFVSFRTPSQGLHTAQAMLLCSNTAVNTVDLLNDGFLFDPCWIQIMGLLKTFDADIKDDESADHYIDFQTMLTFSRKSDLFHIIHSGHVNLSYHWELRAAAVPGKQPLPLEALTINEDCGRLLGQTQHKFYLSCDTSTVGPGSYRALLVLFVDELPKKCVPRHLYDKLRLTKEENELSFEVRVIEIWLDCLKPRIKLHPFIIDFSVSPLICGSKPTTRIIRVKNESPDNLELEWLCDEESAHVCLYIEPQKIATQAFSITECSLMAEALQEGTFQVLYRCVSFSRNFGVELKIEGRCIQGDLCVVTDMVDFGLVKRFSQKSQQVNACSLADNVHWTLCELDYDSSGGGQLVSSYYSDMLSSGEGQICHKGCNIYFNYLLDTQAEGVHCSVLDWAGQYVTLMGAVQEPDVSLSCYVARPERLFLNQPTAIRLTVENHTEMDTAVCWGVPVLQQVNTLSVHVNPKCAELQPAQQLPTEITVTPLKTGPLDDVYIPCFVENQKQPLLFKVEGVVKGLKVRIEWDCGTKHNCIEWPDDGLEIEGKVKHSLSLDSIICQCPTNSLASISIDSLKIEEFITSSEFCVEKAMNHCKNEEEDKVKCDRNGEDEIKSQENMSLVSSIPYLNWPIIGGRYTRGPVSEELERHLNNLFVLEELCESYCSATEDTVTPTEHSEICFLNIPLKEAVTQTIYIRNDTLISTYFETCVVNNFERQDDLPNNLSVIERIEKEIKHKGHCDEWQRRVSKERGLTVFVEPASGELAADDYICLQVTAFANSWGQYTDTLLIQLAGLNQLGLRLTVTVTHPPVTVQPTLRFGAVSFTAGPEYRNVKLNNSSSVPLYICWQLFGPNKELPFNLMLFDSSPFELGLTACFGSGNSPHFQIIDTYTVLNPHSSATAIIKLSPQSANVNVVKGILTETLKAVLIGHVYLTNEARYLTNTESCIRNDGYKLEPLKVDLEANIELPVLSLLNVFNYQHVFKCSFFDVMSTKNKVWSNKTVITVQNQCSTNLTSKVSTLGYFYISEIKYPCHENKEHSRRNNIFLQPGETCELTLVCEVTEDILDTCFEEELVTLPTDDIIPACSVERGLIIFEQDSIRQDVKLELWLYQPFIQFSVSSLTFGLVYIEDTKILTVTLIAPIGKEYFKASIKSGINSVFSITDHSGILQPNTAFLLQVYFSPKACIQYRDLLVIRTCIDKLEWEIPLVGIGTFNYKAHTY